MDTLPLPVSTPPSQWSDVSREAEVESKRVRTTGERHTGDPLRGSGSSERRHRIPDRGVKDLH